MKRILLVLLCCFLLLPCLGCGSPRITPDTVKERFADLPTDPTVALIWEWSYVHFPDYSFVLEEFGATNKVYTYHDGRLYFPTTVKQDPYYYVYISSCDLKGEDVMTVSLLAEVSGINGGYSSDGRIFIEGYDTQDNKCVWMFTAEDQSSKLVQRIESASGKDTAQKFYKQTSPYRMEYLDGQYAITHKQSQKSVTVDFSALVSDTFSAQLEGLTWTERGLWQSGGRLILVIQVDINEDFPEAYPFVLFEYEFETGTLRYVSVLTPLDHEVIDILCCG